MLVPCRAGPQHAPKRLDAEAQAKKVLDSIAALDADEKKRQAELEQNVHAPTTGKKDAIERGQAMRARMYGRADTSIGADCVLACVGFGPIVDSVKFVGIGWVVISGGRPRRSTLRCHRFCSPRCPAAMQRWPAPPDMTVAPSPAFV